MSEDRQKEFEALSVKAEEYLARPGVRLAHHQLLLRLWHYPSFDRHASWFLYHPLPKYGPSEPSIVVAVFWDRSFDTRRFADPLKGIKHGFSIEPTISLSQAEVLNEQLEPKLASLSELALPILVDDGSPGLDGESFGIETFGFPAAIAVRWRSEARTEWQGLMDWAREFRRFLEERLERRPLTDDRVLTNR